MKPDSAQAWARLLLALPIAVIGGAPMWTVVVVLPAVEATFGTDRATAALPYAATMLGFVLGGMMMGRLADRFGVRLPLFLGVLGLSGGAVGAAAAPNLLWFALAYGVAMACCGAAATFGPLIADISQYFVRRRGIAVAITASGNYLAGVIWPPLMHWGMAGIGWRQTHLVMAGLFVMVMLPLIILLGRSSPPRPRAQPSDAAAEAAPSDASPRPLGLSPAVLQALLAFAGLACCIAMAMPQVHIVAHCVDLGLGAQRGAEMLSLMLAGGIVSRLLFGLVMDRLGGLATLVLGSALQGVALVMFLPADGMVALYVVSAVFGLFQGGIVPSYAMIVRAYFPAREAGLRIGVTLAATLIGMAVGGWMAGMLFDLTGSYRAAMWNGIGWNAANLAIAVWLLRRARRYSAL